MFKKYIWTYQEIGMYGESNITIKLEKCLNLQLVAEAMSRRKKKKKRIWAGQVIKWEGDGWMKAVWKENPRVRKPRETQKHWKDQMDKALIKHWEESKGIMWIGRDGGILLVRLNIIFSDHGSKWFSRVSLILTWRHPTIQIFLTFLNGVREMK